MFDGGDQGSAYCIGEQIERIEGGADDRVRPDDGAHRPTARIEDDEGALGSEVWTQETPTPLRDAGRSPGDLYPMPWAKQRTRLLFVGVTGEIPVP